MPFLKLSDIQSREIIPGFHGTFVHSDNLTLAYWTIVAGSSMPVHAHEHEQASTVLEGEFELEVDGESRVLRPGTIALIPSNIPHGGQAISDCRILDVFHPVREDYRVE